MPSYRILFSLLICTFFIYSFFVFTSGTETKSASSLKNSSAIDDGKLLFQKFNCIACHQIYGLGGYMGPDLTNVITAEGKGVEYAKFFIKNGSDKMPNFNLSDEETNKLISYLTAIGELKYPDKSIHYTWFGTIEETKK